MRSVAARGRVPKLAAKVGSFAEAADVYRTAAGLPLPEPRILLLMGPYGFFSRILYRRFGSLCTFLSAPERRALPWHPDPQQFTQLYRADLIDEATPLYGVIGDPVHHSRSPQLHNHWLQRAGLPGSYLPFQVERAEPFFRFAAEAGVAGFSVTLPLKEAVLPQLDAYSAEVERIGACNTVVRRGDAWYGYNTDLHGFLAPLDAHAPGALSGRALVIGAGGVARTVAAALAARGVPWVCVNRTAERARALALEFGGSWLPRESADEGGPYRLVVQTSSAGMEPATDVDPLPHYRFTGGETVYELIYAPEETVLLRRARLAGCRTIGGAAMLRAQAERQFLLFTGREVPRESRSPRGE
jgi:3-dehydroquinate dehydratase/shikimate dehydrogenase